MGRGSSEREGPHGATHEEEAAIIATPSLLDARSLNGVGAMGSVVACSRSSAPDKRHMGFCGTDSVIACFGVPGDTHMGFAATHTRSAPAVPTSRRAERAEDEESLGLSVSPSCLLAERRSLASCNEGEAGGEFRFALLVMGALPPPLIRPLHCEDCSQVVALQLAAIFRLQEALQGRSRA